jgi:predicted nuclease of restriction endonuclease-like RecB superfamily
MTSKSKSNLAARKAFVKKVKYGDYESKIEIPPPINYTSLDLDLTEEVLIDRIKEAKKKYQENTKRDYFKENQEDQKKLDELFFKDLMRVYFPDLKEGSNEYKIILGCNNFYTKEYTVNLFERLLKEVKKVGKESNG